MTTRLSPEQRELERTVFEIVYTSNSKKFPLTCKKCGRVYKDEADYTFNTEECPGFTDATELDLGILYLRNCACGSSLGLNINDGGWDLCSQGEYRKYIGEMTTLRIRGLQRKAILDALGNRSFANSTRSLVNRAVSKIDPKTIKDQIRLEFRAKYNAWLREREHHPAQ